MKKLFVLALCLLLVLSLCACGGKQPENNVPENNAPVNQEQEKEPAAEQEKEPVVEKEEEPSGEQEPSPVDIAKSYIDKPLSELIAVIGEPESSDYASSCLGDGEDGMLIYDGFVVYTYREGDTETVFDVE